MKMIEYRVRIFFPRTVAWTENLIREKLSENFTKTEPDSWLTRSVYLQHGAGHVITLWRNELGYYLRMVPDKGHHYYDDEVIRMHL